MFCCFFIVFRFFFPLNGCRTRVKWVVNYLSSVGTEVFVFFAGKKVWVNCRLLILGIRASWLDFFRTCLWCCKGQVNLINLKQNTTRNTFTCCFSPLRFCFLINFVSGSKTVELFLRYLQLHRCFSGHHCCFCLSVNKAIQCLAYYLFYISVSEIRPTHNNTLLLS